MCRTSASLSVDNRDSAWVDFVRSALLVAVVLCWVDCLFWLLGVAGLIVPYLCNTPPGEH